MKCTKLIYRSPVFGSVQCEDLPNEDSRCIDFGPAGAYALYEKGPEVEMFLTEHSEDLSFCIPEELEDLVVKALFGCCHLQHGEMYLLTEIYARQEPTDFQHSQIISWIAGQMSDGWGEGVEQHEVFTESVRSIITHFDEDECEFRDEEVMCPAYYYLHPWANDSTWSVDLVSTQEVELDIEELDTNEELRQAVLKIKGLIDEVVEELKKIT